MPSDLSEKGLEEIIERSLLNESGYHQSFSADYNRDLCLNKSHLLEFIKETQPLAYDTIIKRGEEKFLKRLSDQIKQKGSIEVLRKGIKDLDLQIHLYYKNPGSLLNQAAIKHYTANLFSVCRQLHYSLSNNKSLDMVLFINGLPLITLELKNHFTGQTVKNAITQYKADRDPKEPLFAFGRCLVHFALDPDLAYMSTVLSGQSTNFLPFNKGHNFGAGNPLSDGGIKTDYVWKEIFAKQSLSNIIENYAQITEETDEDSGKSKKKLVFPRYHQLRVVSALLADAKSKGVGQRYLIQHSAGSGKSNSITWLAHQLVSLHNVQNNQVVFDSVIVVTDRKVLDKQIRDNIKQFAQVKGVVEAIEKGSKQLKSALEDGKKIIITTIQKFPRICNEINDLGSKTFAIIIDEAHSSQSGETALKMNQSLAENNLDEDETLRLVAETGDVIEKNEKWEDDTTDPEEFTGEDMINALIEKRKLLKNASYFAFTATPKNKTIETFGTKVPGQKPQAFDVYSMKQAIEEEFILDVLKNYTTYQSFYKLNKAVEENPQFESKQAQKKLRSYVESHDFSIMEKSKVMIDHFHAESRRQINGQAKAMVVTKSINNAIKYYYAFKEYLKDINSPYKAIVAFSGKRMIDGKEFDEAKLNGFDSGDIPKQFKKNEYRFLIVANKFQTGFDQPLLHTMYVDKKLRDVQAVQTLSRLNRSMKPYKEDTFVLDFFNSADDIKESFEPYYKTTVLSQETDPNKLNDLQDALDNAQAYTLQDVTECTDLYFKNASREEFERIINLCAAHIKSTFNENQHVDFYIKAKSFNRSYAFLSKLISFNNQYWERLYWFLKYLMPKIIPPGDEDLAKGIIQSIELDSYRLSKISTNNIALKGDEELEPMSPTMGGKKEEKEFNSLEALINEFNKRYGIDNWTDDDKVKNFLFEQLPGDLARDENTVNAMKNSDRQNAKITSDKKVEDLMQEVIFTYTDLYKKFTDDPDFKRQYLDFVFEKMWQQGNQNAKRQ